LSRDEQRAAWGVPSGRRALGFLGRVTEQKYPEAIPRALEHLPPEWVGVVVGPLEQEAPIRRAIAQCEVGNRIILAGPTDDPASALAAFDVMLAPSIFEGLPVAWVEAWLLGVPLIATAVAFTEEHPELIRSVPQSATGQELAAAILTDQADAAGTAARVELARTFAREQLGFDRFKAEWSHLLASTVGPEAVTALEGAQRRAAKPRVPLGTPCIPCRQSKGQS
jgi:glycosyltransferase involved in cell wall biosynthesis